MSVGAYRPETSNGACDAYLERAEGFGSDAHQADLLQRRLIILRKDIDAALNHLIPVADGAQGRLSEAMRYAVIGGGKRFRAMLTVAVAELVGASYAQGLQVGAALECVHAQSLIHDDLPCMDDDDLRRGRPTVHRRFDEATAVLAGDALLALAFGILADDAAHPDATVRAALLLKLARATGHDGLAAGQMMDLYPPLISTSVDIMDCQMKKTGSLIRYAVEAGTMLGCCSGDARTSLLRFADKLGLAFQIRDDLLDRSGDSRIAGKTLGKDERNGRRTLVVTLGIREARARADALAQSCRDELVRFGPGADILRAMADFAVSRPL